MKKHQITGLGPVNKDGSRLIFTVGPTPLHAAKAVLEQAPGLDVGDVVNELEDGTVSFVVATSPTAEKRLKKKQRGELSDGQSLTSEAGSIIDGVEKHGEE